MEKFLKRIRIIAVLMMTLLIIAISFLGLYVNNKGIWENVLPKYNLGMELGGYKELHFSLDSSEQTKDVYVDDKGNYRGDVLSVDNAVVPEGYKVETRTIAKNDASKINIDNFETSKEIIQKRLENRDLYEYNIRQDTVTGKIVLEVPDNENVDLNISLVATLGDLTIVDAQNGLILLEDSKLVSVAPYAQTNENGQYEVYLQLNYNEEGKEILHDLTKEYANTDATSDTAKKVQVCLDGQPMVTTYFGQEIFTGTVHVPMGDPTLEYNEYLKLYDSVQEVADIVNEETLPLQYSLTDNIKIQSSITNDMKTVAVVVFAIFVIILSVYMMIKYKIEGLRQAIFSIGYIAILALMFRYTNVTITINSLIALIIVIIINYIFSIKFLEKIKKENIRKIALKESLKGLYTRIIPIVIVAIIFTFMPAIVINSVGMTLFWGLVLQLLFSLITLI